jgi:hypothetical protein
MPGAARGTCMQGPMPASSPAGGSQGGHMMSGDPGNQLPGGGQQLGMGGQMSGNVGHMPSGPGMAGSSQVVAYPGGQFAGRTAPTFHLARWDLVHRLVAL